MGIPCDGTKSFGIMTIDIHTVENGQIKKVHHLEEWTTAMMQLKFISRTKKEFNCFENRKSTMKAVVVPEYGQLDKSIVVKDIALPTFDENSSHVLIKFFFK